MNTKAIPNFETMTIYYIMYWPRIYNCLITSVHRTLYAVNSKSTFSPVLLSNYNLHLPPKIDIVCQYHQQTESQHQPHLADRFTCMLLAQFPVHGPVTCNYTFSKNSKVLNFINTKAIPNFETMTVYYVMYWPRISDCLITSVHHTLHTLSIQKPPSPLCFFQTTTCIYYQKVILFANITSKWNHNTGHNWQRSSCVFQPLHIDTSPCLSFYKLDSTNQPCVCQYTYYHCIWNPH